MKTKITIELNDVRLDKYIALSDFEMEFKKQIETVLNDKLADYAIYSNIDIKFKHN